MKVRQVQAGVANPAWTVQASLEMAKTGFTGNRRARFNCW